MDILAIVLEYSKKHSKESNARVASLILENEDIDYSHRHLRRLVAKVKGRATSSGEYGIEETAKGAIHTYKGSQSITSLEEAISFFEIDLSLWEVERYTCNSWESQTKTGIKPLYQVKVHLARKQKIVDLNALQSLLATKVEPFALDSHAGSKTGVVAISDLHIGAKVESLGSTPDFGISDVVRRLQSISAIVNEYHYESVTVVMLGDFIESFTGLNHPSTWQELEKDGYGTSIVITAYEILKVFLMSLNNVSEVCIVSGNHDRTSVKMQSDPQGSVATLLAFMLKENTPLNISHNSLLLTLEVDRIYYILTHNHYNISRGDMGKVFWEHGKQGRYNVMLGGHWHARKGKRVYRQVEEKDIDQANYRQLAIAPLFTGNFYSESNGWNSSAGFTLIENNGYGKPNVFDYTLP